ncbi:hypothetical protein ASPTUDRAFT_58648 [Aspergillus tubingensis CBS 134.48]|uniref:Uncharacterized protein n=1 Tax=Aspergillus tubingensis (strain CBS 134.48) TaxID=767770 RepID=A0A1L9MWG3_ASPTC|nr:hypothetical protein ASPTUDRAFT_58648 [Aspergillus tubingensis CBS 134.48]
MPHFPRNRLKWRNQEQSVPGLYYPCTTWSRIQTTDLQGLIYWKVEGKSGGHQAESTSKAICQVPMGQETGSKIETTSTITGGLGEKVTILCEGQRSTPGTTLSFLHSVAAFSLFDFVCIVPLLRSPVHIEPLRARPSSYYRLIEIVPFPPGCLPDAVPFALTSASKSLKLCTHLSPPALPPPLPPDPEIKSRNPFQFSPLESTSSKGSKLTTALVASRFVLRHIVSPRRPRDTLNNIPPPAGVDSRVSVRCSSF